MNGAGTKSETTEPLWPPTAPPPWSRLLSFHIPSSELFYMRFGLSLPSAAYPDIPPILAFANLRSRVLFWDLWALERGHDEGGQGNIKLEGLKRDEVDDEDDPEDRPRSSGRDAAGRGGSVVRTNSQRFAKPPPSASNSSDSEGGKRDRTKYPLHDPFKPIEPHSAIQIPGFKFSNNGHGMQGRGVAWSPDGRWCVVVGEYFLKNHGYEACAVIFERDLH